LLKTLIQLLSKLLELGFAFHAPNFKQFYSIFKVLSFDCQKSKAK
jgi:hypothetical protein